jgi:hypothetical protein
MKRRCLAIGAWAVAVVALTYAWATGKEQAPWNIAVYGSWDNVQFGLFPSDLWGASRKLLSRLGHHAPPEIPLVLLYDGLTPGDSELIDLRTNKPLDDAAFVINPATREVNYGDWHTLMRFLIWMHRTFPSRHLLLGFGHHYGWEGFNTDESSPGNRNMDILTMPEYRRAMTEARAAGVHVDVQWFEACACTMIETLYEYAPFSAFVVGNEDTVDFFDMAIRFPRALDGLRDYPDMSPEEAAELLVYTYPLYTVGYLINQFIPFAYILNPRSPSTRGELGLRWWSPTQFAVDCRRIPDVAHAVDELAACLLREIPRHRAHVLQAQRKAQKYTLMPWYVDLYDWAERLEKISIDPVLKEHCRAVKSAVTQAVRASKKRRGDRRRHGILILLPASSQRWRTEQINEFDLSTSYYDLNFARDTRWDELLDELFGQ